MASVRAEINSEIPVRIFRTGNAIFSTPIIDAQERVFVGSADHRFYAIDPVRGETLWTFQTDGVVDSAACLDEDGSLYVPCGDACLYKLSASGDELWRLDLLKSVYGTGSTIFWWEGNAVRGPNGFIYAGNDDFCLYAIKPNGDLAWAMPTGMQIWSACAFANNLVYFSSFDMRVYAMHQDSGTIAWTRATSNFVSSSPALDADGGLYVGAFDGMFTKMHALTGEILWSVPLSAPIYASAAIASDGSVFIGTAEGTIYKLAPSDGSVLSTFQTGSPVWSSVSLGCDPEDPSGYLAYVGTSAGTLLALDQELRHRWSYDVPSGGSVNASPALGRHGIAITTGGGEILYIPYDAYLRSAALPGFRREPRPGPPAGQPLFALNHQGIPVAGDVSITLPVGAPLWLKWQNGASGVRPAVTVDGHGASLIPCVYSKERCIVAVPSEPACGTERVTVSAQYADTDGTPVHGVCSMTIHRTPGEGDTGIRQGARFTIEKMRFDIPAIITPFDQIGIASLSIDVGIIRHDPASGRFIAWGAQTFGISDTGETIGIPEVRRYVFAFEGQIAHGAMHMESRQCDFEITAFAIPLDRFALTAVARHGVLSGTCCYAELGCNKLLWTFARRYWRVVLHDSFSWFRSLARDGHMARRMMSMVRTIWATLRLRFGCKWRPWGLLDIHGDLSAVGNFNIRPDARTPVLPHLTDCRFDAASRTIHAVFAEDITDVRGPLTGIALVHLRTMTPVVLPYNAALNRSGHSLRLRVPASVDLQAGEYEAVILAGTTELATLVLKV